MSQVIVTSAEELAVIVSQAVRRELQAIQSMAVAHDGLLSEKEAASFVRCKPGTLRQWRSQGKGPAYTKTGHRVHYLREDLEAWRRSCRTFTCEARPH